VRALRRLRRDVSERGRTIDSVCAQWMQTVRPMHERFVAPAKRSADLVVSGETPTGHSVLRVLAQLESLEFSSEAPGISY
jgi:uridine kinase